jgi:hypothetical protein
MSGKISRSGLQLHVESSPDLRVRTVPVVVKLL